MTSNSPLDEFIFELVKDRPRPILDYGCGTGRLVEFLENRKIEIFGADTCDGIYESWNPHHARIKKIVDDIIPYPDNYFGTIISNMVFEHIPSEKVNAVA